MNNQKVRQIQNKPIARGMVAALTKARFRPSIIVASEIARKLNTTGLVHNLIQQRKLRLSDLFTFAENEIYNLI